MKIGVFCHLYYLDLWDEIRTYLLNIEQPFDLWLNIPVGVPQAERLDLVHQDARATFDAGILRSENRGRDIGGFLHMVAEAESHGEDYDLVCFVHSKAHKRPNPEVGTMWRRGLLNGVLGSPAGVRAIIAMFEENETVGMVGAEEFVYDEYRTGGPERNNPTQQHLEKLRKRFEIPDQPGKFIAGTIFWARWLPLSEGLSSGYATQSELETDDRQDGLLYHAFETLFGLLMLKAGLTVEGI